jgi:hypothetical protein
MMFEMHYVCYRRGKGGVQKIYFSEVPSNACGEGWKQGKIFGSEECKNVEEGSLDVVQRI